MRKKMKEKTKSTFFDLDNEHDQWITKIGLSHAKEAIKDYRARYSSQNL